MIDGTYDYMEKKQIHVVTVVEARKRLNYIRPLIEVLTDKYHQFEQLQHDLILVSQGDTPIDIILEVKYEVDLLEEELIDIRDQISEFDCVLKDWKTGLFDFIGHRNNEPVWLCYQKGENDIEYYHSWHGGYSTRKQIDFD